MKSPLKSKPLRNPGESLDRELDDLFYDGVYTYASIALFLVIIALLEWWRWFNDSPPAPKLYTAFAVVAVLVAIWNIRRTRSRISNVKLGRDGEKAVGQYLESLREAGAKVFHDIPAGGFNLDHVVIHTTGVYVIETKTLSKPNRGQARLIFDGETVSKGGLAPDRNPIQQVRAERKWLVDLLKESTGRDFFAKAVVLYPGWYIESTGAGKSSEVWVLNPKALPSFISNNPVRLSSEDVNLCAYHLGRYVRTTES